MFIGLATLMGCQCQTWQPVFFFNTKTQPLTMQDEVRSCLCCNKLIQLIEPTNTPESGMWLNGMVGRLTANYGSLFDGDTFIIAVCDGCMDKLKDRTEWGEQNLF